MADAGGAVYLLSSYQSGQQRWRCRGGGGDAKRYTEEDESHGKREHLVPEEILTFASPLRRRRPTVPRFLKWKISDETRLCERLSVWLSVSGR